MNKIALSMLITLALTISLLSSPALARAESTSGVLPITNLDGLTVDLPYETFMAMPKTVVNAALSCYGNLLASGNWGGVKVSDVLNQVGVSSSVGSISFFAADGYSVILPIETALRPDVIIAYEFEGKSLSENLRLVVPGENGNLWIAMITSISVSPTQISGGQSTDIDSITKSQPQTDNIDFQPSPTQPPQTPPQLENNQGTTESPAPPTNQTQNQTSKPSPDSNDSLSQPSVLFSEAVYWIAVAAIFASIAAGFGVFKRRKSQNSR
ncbi:MAG: molybdopterin-dependent oxidoreductase [Candidatus Bathyarchaeota archaeon]|nr:molybdopterin-dependent oxidoreductase [Candidatus Bathyarchaeota archaeon]